MHTAVTCARNQGTFLWQKDEDNCSFENNLLGDYSAREKPSTEYTHLICFTTIIPIPLWSDENDLSLRTHSRVVLHVKKAKKNDSSTPSRNQDKTNPEHKKLPKADNQQKSLTAIRIFKKSAA